MVREEIRTTSPISPAGSSRAIQGLPYLGNRVEAAFTTPVAAMAALLGSVGSNSSCGSVAELQDQLRTQFNAHVTESGARHITQTYELHASVVFSVSVSESENGALENAATLDPQLGGGRSAVAPPSATDGGQTFRHINAIDAVMNQPQDDSVLQKSVAKHIVAALSEVDGSNWTIRAVSRGDQGWTFTYICKDSLHAWTRQTAKTPAKLPIAAWSGKDGQDPVNLSASNRCLSGRHPAANQHRRPSLLRLQRTRNDGFPQGYESHRGEI